MNEYIAPIEATSRALKAMVLKEVLLLDPLNSNPDDANVTLSFDVPNSDFVASIGSKPVINIYLYRMQQKLQSRFSEDYSRINNPNNCAHLVGRRPLFVELFYAVSFWVKSSRDSSFTEQHLASRFLQGMGRYQIVPPEFLESTDFDPDPFGLPISFFSEDPVTSQHEFWSSLGASPKPVIPLSITAPIKVHEPIEVPFTKSINRKYSPSGNPDNSVTQKSEVTLSGKILNKGDFEGHKLVARVEMLNQPEISQQTDVEYLGCYRFFDMPSGKYKLWLEDQTDHQNLRVSSVETIELEVNADGDVIPEIYKFDAEF